MSSARTSWNPFVCGGSDLPLPALLMAKLIACAVLLSGHVRWVTAPGPWQLVLQSALVLSCLALLCNRWVRASAGATGFALAIAAVVPNAILWELHALCAALLWMIAIWQPWPLRIIVLLACITAATGKLPLSVPFQMPFYFALAATLVIPAVRPYAVWAGVLWHLGLLAFDLPVPAQFSYAMLASLLAFVDWPKEIAVIYDGDCGICNASKRLWRKIDFDRLTDWHPFQSGIGARWSIPMEALQKRAHFVADGRPAAGFRAVKRMFLSHPLTYFVILTALAAPPDEWLTYRRIVIGLLVAFFARPFEPLGEIAYLWIARNRYKLSSGGACAVDPKR